MWEHLLLLLRCPFLALSATVGNPAEFAEWLRSIKELQRQQDERAGRPPPAPAHYDVQLIQHTTRYSHLRMHTYQPTCLGDEGGWVGGRADGWRDAWGGWVGGCACVLPA